MITFSLMVWREKDKYVLYLKVNGVGLKPAKGKN